uniref:Putative NHP2 protein n=1 Tax=Isotomurus palustris TaxID=36144 RepID=A0A481SXU6_9HEXA|nr:putative NHP2 protein [Isotomurus palustris]
MEADDSTAGAAMSYEDKALKASIIAKPMANKKLGKKIFKLIKKASKQKMHLRSGLKLVQTKIRKGETGLMILAGNPSPVEVMCHLPAVCEDKGIPYVYVPTGRDIGVAMGVKRCSLVVLIKSHEDYSDLYDDVVEEVKLLPIPPPVEM